MHAPWLRVRMKKPAKHGWLFSAFAGIFAVALLNVLLLIALPPRLPQPTPDLVVMELYVAACALAAARVAGWIARVFGGDDYGWAAGAMTAPLFTVLLLSPAIWQALHPPPWEHSIWTRLAFFLPFALVVLSLVIVLPFCIIGTAVFRWGLRLWHRVVPASRDIPAEEGIVRLFE